MVLLSITYSFTLNLQNGDSGDDSEAPFMEMQWISC